MGERRKHRTADIPLLDEVNELIEKERLLLGLQLLEQKQEAEEWKAKYDSLIGKVSDNIDDDFESLEFAAETFIEKRMDFISQFDLNTLLKNQKDSWIVDLSHANIEPATFASTIKSLFSTRAAGSNLSVAILNHCSLNDDNAGSLVSLFRNNDVHGIDLSYNDLSEAFFLQMVDVMKNRRNSPQYLLLDNNVPMSMSVKHFPALVDTLSESMWGLTVSLEDFPRQISAAHRSAHHKSNHASVNDYKETSKNPMKSFAFLNALRQLWLPEGERDGQTTSKKKSGGAKPKPGKAALGAARGRPHPLQSLSVLGLRHCHLSKKTVACLEATLRLTLTSLTDLDLSFALTGYAGAEALRKVLSLKDCQLVRLGLRGNALGDAGVRLLSVPLQTNRSLTCLDLCSNGITNLGLRSLEAVLTKNDVLHRVDLRNNSGISLQASTALLQLLKSYGAEVHCVFSSGSAAAVPSEGHVQSTSPAAASVIFRSPSKVQHTVPLDKATLLYSIDFNKINANYLEEVQQTKSIDWLWRPVQTNRHLSVLDRQQPIYSSSGGARAAARSRGSTSNTSAVVGSGEDAYLSLNQFCLSFEVRVSSAMGGPVRTNTLPPGSCVTRNAVSDDVSTSEGSSWLRSRVVLSPEELPLKGTVDIYLVVSDKTGRGAGGGGGGGDCVVFEGSSLSVSSVASLTEYSLYSEKQPQRAAGGSLLLPGRLLSSPLHKAVSSSGRGTVLRVFKWSADFPRVQLQCDLKLGALSGSSDGNGSSSSSGDNSLPPQHETLGYEWFLSVYSIDGCSRLMASGRCLGSSSPSAPTSTNNASTAAPQLLEAWLWRRITASFSGVFRLDDVIVLSGRPVSTQVKYPPALLRRCQVLAEHCSLLTSLRTGDDDVTEGQEGKEVSDDVPSATGVKPASINNAELQNLLMQESSYLSYLHNDESCSFPA